MADRNQIVMDIVQGPGNYKKAIGKFPMIVSFSRLAGINREIHELEETAIPVDITSDDFSGNNMDFPRRIRLIDDGSNEGTIVVLTGRDAKGKEIIESVTMNAEGSIDTNNAFIYLSKIHADEVVGGSIYLQLSPTFGFALDLKFIEFIALAQSNGSNPTYGEVIPANAVSEGHPIFTIDEEYDTITFNDTDIINNSGTHLSFFFA